MDLRSIGVHISCARKCELAFFSFPPKVTLRFPEIGREKRWRSSNPRTLSQSLSHDRTVQLEPSSDLQPIRFRTFSPASSFSADQAFRRDFRLGELLARRHPPAVTRAASTTLRNHGYATIAVSVEARNSTTLLHGTRIPCRPPKSPAASHAPARLVPTSKACLIPQVAWPQAHAVPAHCRGMGPRGTT